MHSHDHLSGGAVGLPGFYNPLGAATIKSLFTQFLDDGFAGKRVSEQSIVFGPG